MMFNSISILLVGTSKKILVETTLPGNFVFYLRFGMDGTRSHFQRIFNEYLRDISLGLHGSLFSFKNLHEIMPENLTISSSSLQNSQEIETPIKGFSSSFAGVSGILRRQECDRTSVNALQKQAFGDLQTLMHSATEVLSVLDRYSSMIGKEGTEISEPLTFISIPLFERQHLIS